VLGCGEVGLDGGAAALEVVEFFGGERSGRRRGSERAFPTEEERPARGPPHNSRLGSVIPSGRRGIQPIQSRLSWVKV
jgi:hypothetical protein